LTSAEFYRKFIQPPAIGRPDLDRRAWLINVILAASSLFLLGLAIIEWIVNPNAYLELYTLGGILLFQACIWFVHLRAGTNWAGRLMAVGYWGVLCLVVLFSAGINSASLFAQILLILIVGLILGGREALLLALLTVMFNFGMLYLGAADLLPEPLLREPDSMRWAIHSVNLFMAGTLIYFANRAEKKVREQVQLLQAKSDIDRAILSSFDLGSNVSTLLKYVVAQLQVDAANLMLFDPPTYMLRSFACIGFKTERFADRHIRLGEGHAGTAALENHPVHVDNLANQNDNPRLASAAIEEGFVSYYALPLIAKGQIKGVLEVFHSSALDISEEWHRTLETFASQATIAIDTVTSYEGLQKANAEMILSYDATIEGWSHALDLRDRLTEGHTQRVADLSVWFARKIGVSEKDLVHFRRGALLHDIGKMAVPDQILYKRGKLNKREWALMKLHPQHAQEMLTKIRYLHEAIDIPYCHHEKWDGSGYPQGLKGEEIPLAARIFAVIDVYDALTSDRPYRKAWTRAEAMNYIREQSGKHFDPKVGQEFLKLDLDS